MHIKVHLYYSLILASSTLGSMIGISRKRKDNNNEVIKIDDNKLIGLTKNNEEVIKKIKEILETIKPYLYMDGGDLEFVKYEDNYVYIKLLGMCQGCSMADVTIENGIFETLKQEIPEIKGVINCEI